MSVRFISPVPIVEHPLNPQALSHWVNLHCPGYRPVAKAISQLVLNNHYSFPDFLEHLGKSVDSLKPVLGTSPFAMIFANSLTGKMKSGEWIASMVVPELKPTLIGCPLDIKTAVDNGKLNELPYDLVIVDDALYSGNQVRHIIVDICHLFPKNKFSFHILAPFISTHAVELLKLPYSREYLKVITYEAKRVSSFYTAFNLSEKPTIREGNDAIISDMEFFLAKANVILNSKTKQYSPLTFGFKIADDSSFPTALTKGIYHRLKGPGPFSSLEQLKKNTESFEMDEPPVKIFIPPYSVLKPSQKVFLDSDAARFDKLTRIKFVPPTEPNKIYTDLKIFLSYAVAMIAFICGITSWQRR